MWPFKRKKPAETVNDAEGCLFGLTPPPGCYFNVDGHRGSSWHVQIYRGGKELARGCALTLSFEPGDDASVIVAAAQEALEVYERKQAIRHLEGCYPPKRTEAKA